MSAAAASPPTTSAWALAGRFARFIGGLREAMAAGAEHNPVLMDLAARLWNRLTEAAERFAAIAAHPVARSRRRPAEPAPHAGRCGARRCGAGQCGAGLAPRAAPDPAQKPMAGWRGWRRRRCRSASSSPISWRQPEMTELLATAPRLWRVLRPLCRMFGITPPEAPPPAPDTPPRRAPEAAPDPDRPRRRSEAAAIRDHGPLGYRPPLFGR